MRTFFSLALPGMGTGFAVSDGEGVAAVMLSLLDDTATIATLGAASYGTKGLNGVAALLNTGSAISNGSQAAAAGWNSDTREQAILHTGEALLHILGARWSWAEHQKLKTTETAATLGDLHKRLECATKSGPLRTRMGDPPAGMRKPQAHHDLSQKFRDRFERAGLDIDDPAHGRWVEGSPVGRHQNWSPEFNREWERFFARNPNPTQQQILDFKNTLRTDPRFQ
jgi:hypothetical protein